MTSPAHLSNTQRSQRSPQSPSSTARDSQTLTNQISQIAAVDGMSTPPSSLSQQQENSQKEEAITRIDQQDAELGDAPTEQKANVDILNGHADQRDSVDSSARASVSPASGSKRMVNGAVKPPSPLPGGSVAHDGAQKHMRNKSMETTGSTVTNLSAQLKTRLSYAMVKVQNGWEDRSLDEVETLASHMSSPVSTTTTSRTPRSILHSPRDVVMSSVNSRSRDLSQVMAADSDENRWSAKTYSNPHFHDQSRNEHRQHPIAIAPGDFPPSGPALVPAPELTAVPSATSATKGQRRGGGHSGGPPALMTAALQGDKISQNDVASDPTAIQQRNRAATPTPQEQDAVDTLLFMSSPANSGYFPNRGPSAQPSPLRPEFAMPARKGEDIASNGLSTPQRTKAAKRRSMGKSGRMDYHEKREHRRFVENPEPSAKRRSINFGDLKSESDVDRLLDQMAERQSSDDDERVPTRENVAAGMTQIFSSQHKGFVRM